MQFVKRDFVLVAASVFFILGLSPFMPLIYALIIGTSIFFGIKFFVMKQKQKILKASGKGICAECGSVLTGEKCQSCES